MSRRGIPTVKLWSKVPSDLQTWSRNTLILQPWLCPEGSHKWIDDIQGDYKQLTKAALAFPWQKLELHPRKLHTQKNRIRFGVVFNSSLTQADRQPSCSDLQKPMAVTGIRSSAPLRNLGPLKPVRLSDLAEMEKLPTEILEEKVHLSLHRNRQVKNSLAAFELQVQLVSDGWDK